jgi:hypothetical protein
LDQGIVSPRLRHFGQILTFQPRRVRVAPGLGRIRLFGPRWQNRPEAGVRALRGPLVRKDPSTRPKGSSDSGGPHRPAHAATAVAPLGLRLCAAKPELQARARPLGQALAAVSGLSCADPRERAQRPQQARTGSSQVRERLEIEAPPRRRSVAADRRGVSPGRLA